MSTTLTEEQSKINTAMNLHWLIILRFLAKGEIHMQCMVAQPVLARDPSCGTTVNVNIFRKPLRFSLDLMM